MFKSVLRSFASSRIFMVVAAVAGYQFLSTVREGFHIPLPSPAPWFMAMWYQWDANWYMSIIIHGYQNGYQWVAQEQSNVAFFPLYPAAVKGLGFLLGGRVLLAGILLSAIFLLAGMVFLFRLVQRDFNEEIAGRTVWLLAIFPTSIFFSTLYTESLFLMTSVAAFYYARAGRWGRAGFWGMLASLTRITGLFLLLPLAWEYLAQRGFSLRSARAAVWLLAVPGGLLIYMLFLYLEFHQPLAFAQSQAAGWGHGFTPVWKSLTRDLSFLIDQSEKWVIYEFAATALLAGCLVAGLRKLPGSYNIYMLVSLLVPVLSGTTKSMSRYLLVVFPVFIVLALATKRAEVRYAVYAVSLALLAVSTAAFVTGRWVA